MTGTEIKLKVCIKALGRSSGASLWIFVFLKNIFKLLFIDYKKKHFYLALHIHKYAHINTYSHIYKYIHTYTNIKIYTV